MCNAPSPPPAPAAPPPAAKPVSAETKEARRQEQSAAKNAKGRKSTILTGSQGVQDQAATTKKTLLGQ